MSNKTQKTPSDATLQSTRQMLDELDALMEKMLTLPVNDLDEPAAMPELPAKGPALAASLTLLERREPEAPIREPMSEAAAPLPYHPPHFEAPANPAPRSEPLGYEFPEPAPLTNELTPPSALAEVEPLLNEIAEPPASSLSTLWVYLPLVWVNQGFDGATLILGGAGRWMRSEGGRMLLGLSGVLMLAAGVGWFLKDYLGWHW